MTPFDADVMAASLCQFRAGSTHILLVKDLTALTLEVLRPNTPQLTHMSTIKPNIALRRDSDPDPSLALTESERASGGENSQLQKNSQLL
jgi:hypothetical protein